MLSLRSKSRFQARLIVDSYRQKASITITGPYSLIGGTSSKSSENQHLEPNIRKIEPGDLQLVCLMMFRQILILIDCATDFMVFQILGLPKTVEKHSKPSPRII